MTTTDPVEVLRAAAAKLREMAAAATRGPWRCVGGTNDDSYNVVNRSSKLVAICRKKSNPADAEWIALMGPDKAEILALWLEKEADGQEMLKQSGLIVVYDTSPTALAFARSILEDK